MGRGRAFRKLIVDDRDHDEVPSSLYAVVSNNDLLIEILLRLPASSILLFKSVSKRWLSLITRPIFTTLRCCQNPNVEPPSGLFLQRYISRFIYDYVTFDIRFLDSRSPPLNTTFRFDFHYEGEVKILQSCNGLFLCRVINPITHYVHYVCNPSINNRSKRLPPCCNYSGSNGYAGGMRLAFDPIKSPYYKLVFAGDKRDDDYIQIQTYSSETGTWSICRDRFPKSNFLSFDNAIYWNNAFHWIHGTDIHSKLDVEHLVLTTIQPPDVLDTMSCSCKLFESHCCLLFLCEYTNDTDHTRQLNIYEMSKGCSGWSMKYVVNLDDIIMKLFPITGRLQPAAIMGLGWGCYSVHCIVLGEKEEDSFLVMETCGKVMQYKIVLETIRKLYDWGPLHHELPGLNRRGYQYYASFASV